jgi:cell division protein FtsZ
MTSTSPRRSKKSSNPENQTHLPNFQEAPARICAVGVGGGGTNAIIRMMDEHPIPGVEYICINTDIKSLGQAKKAKVIQIGNVLTRGHGAGGNPQVGFEAAEQSKKELEVSLSGADLVFLAIGMGGGTGTGAAPLVADIAKKSGALVVAVATTPFAFEGVRRMETAHSGLDKLRDHVDNMIIIHNDRLLELSESETTMETALRMADDAVMLGVHSVAELVNRPGDINVDLADVKSIMGLPGHALMAIGEANGKDAPLVATKKAISNPLLDLSIQGAKGILFNVNGGNSMTLAEVNEAGKFVESQVDRNAMIFFGMANNRNKEEHAHVTIIATGIPIENAQSYTIENEPIASPNKRYDDLANDDLDIPPFLRRPK